MKPALPRQFVVVLAAVVAMAGLGFFVWERCASGLGEGHMFGPYTASDYAGSLDGVPLSTLDLPGNQRLEAYEVPNTTGPVVLRRAADGQVQWAKLLVPQDVTSDGQTNRWEVREFRLLSSRKLASGYRIAFVCNWTRGGRERGVIILTRDLLFHNYSISW